jgi:hypothetical protein
METMGERLAWAREQAGFRSARSAAMKFGWVEVTYRSHEKDGRGYDLETAERYGRAFKVDPIWLLHGIGQPHRKGVPVVGIVGAGGELAYDGPQEGDPDTIPRPPGAPPETVAVEVRGDSLGPGFDRWYALYSSVEHPANDALVGRLCVVGTKDGRTLIKWVRQGRRGYNLVSGNGAIEENVRLIWGAHVITMMPRPV